MSEVKWQTMAGKGNPLYKKLETHHIMWPDLQERDLYTHHLKTQILPPSIDTLSDNPCVDVMWPTIY